MLCAVAGLSTDRSPQNQSRQCYSKFEGKIGVSVKVSSPDWPKLVRAPAGAPNIVLILLNDIGFGDTSTFGAQTQTPELDRLSAQGLRYNDFNTTAKCSPTRAALLTGRIQHRVGFGDVAAGGYPGYNFIWKDSAASTSEILRQHGYSTSAFGKWHNIPPMGDYTNWSFRSLADREGIRVFLWFHGRWHGESLGVNCIATLCPDR